MSYLSYLLSLIYEYSNAIVLPIPVSPGKYIEFSIFNLFIGFLILSVIIWFICRLLDFEISFMWHNIGKLQDNNFHGYDRVNYGVNAINRGKTRYKFNRIQGNTDTKRYYKTNPSSVHYYSKR